MGIDGSGKSTLANELSSALGKRNQPSVVVWVCLRPVLLKPFILVAKRLLVKGKDKFKDYEQHNRAKRTGMKRLSWTHSIYLFVMILDYLPQVFYKVYIQKLLGKHVICDRYYHDLMLDYGVHTSASTDRVLQLIKLADKLFPVPDLFYYVSLPSEVALGRKSDIPSLQYLDERANIYNKIAERFQASRLDGVRMPAENCEIILADMDKIS